MLLGKLAVVSVFLIVSILLGSMTHPKFRIAVFTAFAAANFLALSNGVVAELPTDKIDFNRDIRPLLSDNCFACHAVPACVPAVLSGISVLALRPPSEADQ